MDPDDILTLVNPTTPTGRMYTLSKKKMDEASQSSSKDQMCLVRHLILIPKICHLIRGAVLCKLNFVVRIKSIRMQHCAHVMRSGRV